MIPLKHDDETTLPDTFDQMHVDRDGGGDTDQDE